MKRNQAYLHGVILLLGVFLVGCAAPLDPSARTSPQPEAPQAERAEPSPEPDSREQDVPAAARALQDQAEAASAEGDHERAAALLERAIGIAPNHPVLWHNLAVVHYRQGDYRQAESMALRSLDVGSGQASLMRRNWELIAASRDQAGDRDGASAARERLRTIPAGQRE
ncbi:tetratricopeptide (TPR) repeat protein [Natronocella acetinitrilica]|uniref:Tetratricopeptide (TPR) repeat protein n=1 Tax=Natronocella acetinitrilica TaxID=414046 RepID=A0AAE3KG84_9GAMM|nr:tetratricopeptide repeat protein [Natronocella acetinitrilica]MCP1674947.1 tetratricopeptide (TPR) repeat protein [Natronocella acetinitrilica]